MQEQLVSAQKADRGPFRLEVRRKELVGNIDYFDILNSAKSFHKVMNKSFIDQVDNF